MRNRRTHRRTDRQRLINRTFLSWSNKNMCHDGRFGVHRKSNRFIVQPVRTALNRFNSILILLRQLIATWTGSPREPFRNGWGKNQIRLPYYSAVNYKQDGGTRSAKTNGRTTTRSYQERERRKQREEEEEEWKKRKERGNKEFKENLCLAYS